jgi:pimeloyl-ACP methyl ester carboxylesterase
MSSAAPSVGSAVAVDGARIYFDEAGIGEPPIVFVHGWSCDRSHWTTQMDHFSKTNRVVAIDLCGHGESGGRQRSDWSVSAFGEDVAAVLVALDLRDAVLVGHSMGAAVIVETAAQAPDRVAGLVTVDYFFDVDSPTSDADRERMLSRMQGDFRGVTDAWVRSMFVAQSDPALVERVARAMASAPANAALPSLDGVMRHNSALALSKVSAPVHFINSDRRSTNLEAARRHHPDVTLTVLTGCGHFVHLERPQEFNRVLARAVGEFG